MSLHPDLSDLEPLSELLSMSRKASPPLSLNNLNTKFLKNKLRLDIRVCRPSSSLPSVTENAFCALQIKRIALFWQYSSRFVIYLFANVTKVVQYSSRDRIIEM